MEHGKAEMSFTVTLYLNIFVNVITVKQLDTAVLWRSLHENCVYDRETYSPCSRVCSNYTPLVTVRLL